MLRTPRDLRNVHNFINPRELQVHQEPFFALTGIIVGGYHDIPSADVSVEDPLRNEPPMTYPPRIILRTRRHDGEI